VGFWEGICWVSSNESMIQEMDLSQLKWLIKFVL
jgi:hypothetical protein